MEPVYRTLEIAAKLAVAVSGSRITYQGAEHIPARGGAVVAINHTSYLDWLPAALSACYRGRRLRFMIKAEMTEIRSVDYLIRHTGTIPVDRRAGAAAYERAVQALRAGELVAVYPEATISRSFELKEFKSGAARMAHEANVPIIPLIVWGAHRRWTKDHPKTMGRAKIPMVVRVGAPLSARESVAATDTAMREAMTALLHGVQQSYDHPPGAYWVPRRLGGAAPTPTEAKALDEAELAERARRRAERKAKSH
jgi:1-acyl-sn-glycerol-3-phosphate acyltransferase